MDHNTRFPKLERWAESLATTGVSVRLHEHVVQCPPLARTQGRRLIMAQIFRNFFCILWRSYKNSWQEYFLNGSRICKNIIFGHLPAAHISVRNWKRSFIWRRLPGPAPQDLYWLSYTWSMVWYCVRASLISLSNSQAMPCVDYSYRQVIQQSNTLHGFQNYILFMWFYLCGIH